MAEFSESGWYDVPDSSDQRYWDGEQWTESYRPRVGAPDYAPPAPTSGLAIASLVLGIASFFVWCLAFITGIAGIVAGLAALRECQPRGPKRGRGLAIAGMICSAAAFTIMAFFTFMFLIVLRAS